MILFTFFISMFTFSFRKSSIQYNTFLLHLFSSGCMLMTWLHHLAYRCIANSTAIVHSAYTLHNANSRTCTRFYYAHKFRYNSNIFLLIFIALKKTIEMRKIRKQRIYRGKNKIHAKQAKVKKRPFPLQKQQPTRNVLTEKYKKN